MKRLVFTSILTITFVAMLSSQTQTEFIIGADWLNNPTTESVPSPSDWTHMKDLGLTWGHIILCKEQSCREDAFSVLNSASQNGMKVILYRRNLSDPANGQRWQYHPEYQLQYLPSVDFDGKKMRCLCIDVKKALTAGIDLEGFGVTDVTAQLQE